MLRPYTLLLNVIDASPTGDDITFKVCVMDPARPTQILSVIERNYSQCALVSAKLHEAFAGQELPELLGPSFFRGLDPAYVEARRASLEVFLNTVASHRLMCTDAGFLSLVGYEQAVACEEKEGAAFTVGYERWTVARCLRVAGATAEQHEADVVAARMWMRGTPFVFRAVVPSQRVGMWKTRVFVTDNALGTELILVVQRMEKSLAVSEAEVHAWRRTVVGLDPAVFYVPLYVDVVAPHVFAVYPVAPHGSLCDSLHSTLPFTRDSKHRRQQQQRYAVQPMALHDVQLVGRKLLYILRSCHRHNISLPLLSLGNLMMSERHGVVLADVEDIFAGTTRFPALYPYEEREGGDELPPRRTPFDILLFGVILLQLCGVHVEPWMLCALLTCQGEPFVAEDADKDEASPRNPVCMLNGFAEIPLSIKNILFYIFHPTIPADLRVLANHTFFNDLSMKVVEVSTVSSPAAVANLRKKDVELFHRAQDRWKKRLVAASENKACLVAQREHLRKVKRREGTGRQCKPLNSPLKPSEGETAGDVGKMTASGPGDKSGMHGIPPPPPPPPPPSMVTKGIASVGPLQVLSKTVPPPPPPRVGP
ncbi:putative p21-activated kinase 3 [Trypanosoma grayi]|uniref:putative p21-activated kinase 3 n=1 Tax=Trypanosoma grayi TaxID=71804 RepID=UPI0004F4213D|nr:putative p21-activated kinase 3 [Trypanosoma grayi]KEG14927.1 putative p21-activated kinase 3 [Trypanosoma grayi]